MQQPDQNVLMTVGNNKRKHCKLLCILCLLTSLLATVSLPKYAIARNAMPDYATLVEQQSKVVVKITARKSSMTTGQSSPKSPQQLPEQLRRYFEQLPGSPALPPNDRGRPSSGLGSGFIVSDDGYIVTNHHVIDGANDIEVGLQNRKTYSAILVGSDPRTDLAVLKIEADNLPVAELGDSDSLKVGQWVLAIGSPFGFDYTATQGIVSALSRSLPSNESNYVPFIQTDVAVNPGNSGGPLFDLEGHVVGVNSQIYTRSGGYMGLSFAIPVDVVKSVVSQLRETGHVSRGWLGVSIQEINRDLAESFGMDHPRGALVSDVTQNSPASNGGMEPGDVILSFDGKSIPSSSKLPAVVGSTPVNTVVDVVVLRDGVETTLEITVGELGETASQLNTTAPAAYRLAGLTLSPLSEKQKNDFGVKSGLFVEAVEPQSTASQSGIRAGDILLTLNHKSLTSLRDFREIYRSSEQLKSMPILVARGNGRLYLPLKKEQD